MFDGKSVLVTGAAGFIGANLVARLVQAGARVRGTWHRTPPPVQHPGVDFVKGLKMDFQFLAVVQVRLAGRQL